jgi:hypothetical protein
MFVSPDGVPLYIFAAHFLGKYRTMAAQCNSWAPENCSTVPFCYKCRSLERWTASGVPSVACLKLCLINELTGFVGIGTLLEI